MSGFILRLCVLVATERRSNVIVISYGFDDDSSKVASGFRGSGWHKAVASQKMSGSFFPYSAII